MCQGVCRVGGKSNMFEDDSTCESTPCVRIAAVLVWLSLAVASVGVLVARLDAGNDAVDDHERSVAVVVVCSIAAAAQIGLAVVTSAIRGGWAMAVSVSMTVLSGVVVGLLFGTLSAPDASRPVLIASASITLALTLVCTALGIASSYDRGEDRLFS